MIAYKFTRPGGVSLFADFRWPLPVGLEPGSWVEAPHGVDVCRSGVHACRPAHLPFWIAQELWEAELDGEIVEVPRKVAAPRGRLLAPVEAWGETLAAAFALDCARRARDLAVERLRATGHEAEADRLGASETAAAIGASGSAITQVVDGVPGVLAGYATDAAANAAKGSAAAPAFIAAVAADSSSEASVSDTAFQGHQAERARQARWLAKRLSLVP